MQPCYGPTSRSRHWSSFEYFEVPVSKQAMAAASTRPAIEPAEEVAWAVAPAASSLSISRCQGLPSLAATTVVAVS